MTKPHTTLSEAVRALELPTPDVKTLPPLMTTWENEVFARGALAMRSAAAALVEQHEAKEPVAETKEQNQAAIGLFQKSADQMAREFGCLDTETGLIYFKDQDHAETYAELMDLIERRQAQPTLAATQAGDAKLLEEISDLKRKLEEQTKQTKYANADADMYANAWQRELAAYDGLIRNKRHHIDAMVLTTREFIDKLKSAEARVRTLEAGPAVIGQDAGIALFFQFGDKFDIKTLQKAGRAAIDCMKNWGWNSSPTTTRSE